MKAVVVYESLWGNTATIARAIALGLGAGTPALSTCEAPYELISEAELIVAGAPVHSLNLPTEKSREMARTGNLGPGGKPPDLSHPPLRSWLSELPHGHSLTAAFDTRVNAWYGHSAAPKILNLFKHAGYRPLGKPMGFYVGGHRLIPTANGSLLPGETERAYTWGVELARRLG